MFGIKVLQIMQTHSLGFYLRISASYELPYSVSERIRYQLISLNQQTALEQF